MRYCLALSSYPALLCYFTYLNCRYGRLLWAVISVASLPTDGAHSVDFTPVTAQQPHRKLIAPVQPLMSDVATLDGEQKSCAKSPS